MHMLDWHGTGGGEMMAGWGLGILFFATWLVWLVVGILAIIWLWKKIDKK